MKKITAYIPFIAAGAIIALLLGLFAAGTFDPPKRTTITTSTLTEMVETDKLTTAKYIHHGIARAKIADKKGGYVLYYAIVKPNIELSEIQYMVDDEAKTVTVILPEFDLDVELIEDDNEHKFYYHPSNMSEWTATDVSNICKFDAQQKARDNKELMDLARESVEDAITALLDPILVANEYTLVIQ